jgi:hypothetical protein
MNTLVLRGVAFGVGNQLSMVFVIQESKTLHGGYLPIQRFNQSWLDIPSTLKQTP